MAAGSSIQPVEVDAKFLHRNGIYSVSYSDQVMAKIRKTLKIKRISLDTFCEFYRMDRRLFDGMK